MNPPRAALRFTKMHGAGNDFVLIDRRTASPLDAVLIARLCDRHRGIGCDQLLTIEAPRSAGAALAYGIWNADGSRAGQCGNGARCVAAWALRQGLLAAGSATLDSPSGPVRAQIGVDGTVSIELQAPDFDPAALPMRAAAADFHSIDVDGRQIRFGAVSMGNPHVVIEVEDVAAVDAPRIAAALQSDPRFPDRCNVGFAQVLDRRQLRLRVVERGAGETLACGSGACAAVAVLARRGRLDGAVEVALPGGTLLIEWPGGAAPVRMSGPTAFVFEGEWLA